MAEKVLTKEEIMADLDIQLRQAQLKKAQMELVDTEEEIQHKENKRKERRAVQRANARQLEDEAKQRKTRIMACPHRKGGTDYAGWKRGINDKHSVLPFQFPNGDFKVQCSRCGNAIIPPVEPLKIESYKDVEYLADYGFVKPEAAGYFLKEDKQGYTAAKKMYDAAWREYSKWLQLPTDNIAATSGQALQVAGAMDWKRLYRLALHEVFAVPIFQEQRWLEGRLAA